MSSLFQLWRFENMLAPGQEHQGCDALYVPHVGYTTGDLDIHDIALDDAGRPIFVNTLFGCLATLSPRHSFVPLWLPPFLSKLVPEDRCHLNGLSMEEGRPRFVTAAMATKLKRDDCGTQDALKVRRRLIRRRTFTGRSRRSRSRFRSLRCF